TGSRYASAVLRFRPGAPPAVVARLPAGVRYPGVATLGGKIYVAGGVTTAGTSDAVFAVDPRRGRGRRVATLPGPPAPAPLAVLDGALYLIGGDDRNGAPLAKIVRIDPATGTVASAGQLPAPLADAAAATDRGRIVVLGGAGAAASNGVYELSL